MLYAFDLDGTLIRSFLRDGPCERCHGTRVIAVVSNVPVDVRGDEREGREIPCPDCVKAYDRVELLPGRAGALWRLAQYEEASFAIITNQGGVAFGYQTPRQVGERLARSLLACDFFYRRPVSVHIAYGHEKATIVEYREPQHLERRKPLPFMLREAMRYHGTSPSSTVYVGDMDSDAECASAAGVPYVDAKAFFGP